MSTVIQRRRGTTAQHASFTGLAGEITVNTTSWRAVVHDGVTAGGHPVALESDVLNNTPVGLLADFAGATAPTKWLLCYGQAISRTTYAALFAVISTTYGVGDGSTTFNLPDLRGRVSAGQDDMGGTSANRLTAAGSGLDGDVLAGVGGLETHTLTVAQMPAHAHPIGVQNSPSADGGAAAVRRAVTGDGNANSIVDSTGGDGAHPNVQPTIIMNKIIYAGV